MCSCKIRLSFPTGQKHPQWLTTVCWSFRALSTVHVCLPQSDLTPVQTALNVTSITTQATSTDRNLTSPSVTLATVTSTTIRPSSSVQTSLGLITVRWLGCQGTVILEHSSKSMPVCDNSKTRVESLMGKVCRSVKGCKGTLQWRQSKERGDGYNITESGAVENVHCAVLTIQCKGWCSVCFRLVVSANTNVMQFKQQNKQNSSDHRTDRFIVHSVQH